MPEFRLYATRNESLEMLRDLFARGDLRVVLGEQTLDVPSPRVYTALTAELAQELSQHPKMHLYGAYSTHPPHFTKLSKGPEAGRYFLGDTGGGPHVLFRLGTIIDNVLTSTGIWTQPHYLLTADQVAGATPAVRAAHADMVKRLKQHLVRWEGLWISAGALQLLKDGRVELPGDLKPLGVRARNAKDLPQLKPVPPSSTKTTRRKVAAKKAGA